MLIQCTRTPNLVPLAAAFLFSLARPVKRSAGLVPSLRLSLPSRHLQNHRVCCLPSSNLSVLGPLPHSLPVGAAISHSLSFVIHRHLSFLERQKQKDHNKKHNSKKSPLIPRKNNRRIVGLLVTLYGKEGFPLIILSPHAIIACISQCYFFSIPPRIHCGLALDGAE